MASLGRKYQKGKGGCRSAGPRDGIRVSLERGLLVRREIAGVCGDEPHAYEAGGERRLEKVRRVADVELVPVDQQQADVACDAYRDCGRESGHPATLAFAGASSYPLINILVDKEIG